MADNFDVPGGVCGVDGCGLPIMAGGVCPDHGKRVTGDPHADFFLRNAAGILGSPDVPAATPSQVANPWRATWRTVVQVGIPSFLLLLAVLPAVLEAIVEGLGGVLPPEAVAWCGAAAVAITALAGTLARIAAIPGVNAWLSVVGLDAGPTGRRAAR